MSSIWSGLARGAAAGAAGTTALNAATFLDMTVRGRAPSDAPQQVVSALAAAAGTGIPGGRRERARRLSALGTLTGLLTGVALGAGTGVLRSAGVRLPAMVGGPLLGLVAMAASDAPIAALRISDPRGWTAADWVADGVPHLVYGLTAHATLVAVSRVAESREPLPSTSPATLLRAAALGAATGSRSTAGIAAVALTSSRNDRGVVASRLGSRTGTAVTALLAAGELVADKLPATPSRLSPPAVLPRAVLGAASAAAMAARDGHDAALPALVGLAGAAGASVVGMRLRATAARRFGSDLPGALVEDALTALLGWLGARRRRA